MFVAKNKPRTYYIKTYGCQYNKADSERIAADYQARGMVEIDNWREADEVVINTCAVRQSAEDRVHGFLNNIKIYLAENQKPKPKLILTGCMTHYGSEKLLEMLPMIDEVLPVNEVGFNYQALRKDKHHAFVQISTGCNSFCTYCIVPYSRGRERSRPFAEIIKEIKLLADQGYTEITLVGMNVNSWGLEKVGVPLRKMLMDRGKKILPSDLPENASQYLKPNGTPPFVKLLQAISEFDQIKKIRFLTSNPWDFHDELIKEVGKNKKIDRYVHLPVQSGSNSVLQRMNRGYTRESYLTVVKKLKQADENITIGTDIIVGFPGETEAEFQETVSLAKQIDFKIAFVAMYSPRPGTVAWRLYEDDIPHKEKKRRWLILDRLINRKHLNERPKIV